MACQRLPEAAAWLTRRGLVNVTPRRRRSSQCVLPLSLPSSRRPLSPRLPLAWGEAGSLADRDQQLASVRPRPRPLSPSVCRCVCVLCVSISKTGPINRPRLRDDWCAAPISATRIAQRAARGGGRRAAGAALCGAHVKRAAHGARTHNNEGATTLVSRASTSRARRPPCHLPGTCYCCEAGKGEGADAWIRADAMGWATLTLSPGADGRRTSAIMSADYAVLQPRRMTSQDAAPTCTWARNCDHRWPRTYKRRTDCETRRRRRLARQREERSQPDTAAAPGVHIIDLRKTWRSCCWRRGSL